MIDHTLASFFSPPDSPQSAEYICRRHLDVEKITDFFLIVQPSERIPNQTLHRQITLDLLKSFAEYINLLADKDIEIQTIE